MTIIRPKSKEAAAPSKQAPHDKADAFIAGAPDSTVRARGVRQGSGTKQKISLNIETALLERVDALAASLGQTRAGLMNLAILQAVERGFEIDTVGRGSSDREIS